MEMKSSEMPESGVQQKPESEVMPESGIQLKPEPEVNHNPVENGVNPEKDTDEMAGSEVNQEPAETCHDTVVETDLNTEKRDDPEARLEVNQKPTETCQESVAETDVIPEKQVADPGVIYRCKRCRQMVATQEFVVTHKVGRGEESFKMRKKFHVDEDDKKPECMCIFVEPMKWMQAVEEGYVSQKLYCMGCKALLGQFNWAGMQCTCGTWVIPAFQLTKSKIDECSM